MKLLKLYIKPEDISNSTKALSEEQYLSDHIEHANRFFTRLRGLLGRDELPEGYGLLLSPCAAIHCSGMKFPIDVVFLDGEFRVLRIVEHLAPKQKAVQKKAKHVLELKAGQLKTWGIQVGQILFFVE